MADRWDDELNIAQHGCRQTCGVVTIARLTNERQYRKRAKQYPEAQAKDHA
jgi:hypothetical protein